MGDFLTLKQPAMAFAGAAAVALIVGGLWYYQQDSGLSGSSSTPTEGIGDPEPPRFTSTRRHREVESRNEGIVDSYEVSVGRVIIENEKDPEQPVVVWHFVDDGTTPGADL